MVSGGALDPRGDGPAAVGQATATANSPFAATETFADVIAGEIFFDVFKQPGHLAVLVDGGRERAAEAREVGAAINGVDVVGEAENGFRVAVVVLQRHFHGQLAAIWQVAFPFEEDGLVVEAALSFIEMLDEFGDAAFVMELKRVGRLLAFVGEVDG